MPATVELRENGRIMFYVFKDPWGLTDMHAVHAISTGYYDQATQKIHVLIDVTQAHNVPPGILRARTNPDVSHPNSGHIVIVGAVPLLRTMGETIFRLTRYQRARFFDTQTEAWDYLRGLIGTEVIGNPVKVS